MKVPVRRPVLLGPAFMCVTLVVPQSYAEDESTRPETGMSWDSHELREIAAGYKSLWDTYHNAPEKIAGGDLKSQYDQVERLVDALFRKGLSQENLRQLVASCDSLPVDAKDRSRFANDLLAFIVRSLVDLGERDTLVKLLSTRCPARVQQPYHTIEFYLAFRGKELGDLILILGEAYSKCTVPEVRHDIAAAVRRGFAGLGIHGDDDSDFAANAMRWYEQEKDGLVVNGDFWKNEMRIQLESYDRHPEFYDEFPGGMTREQLFERRPSSPERPLGDLRPQTPRRPADNGRERSSPESADAQGNETLEGTWDVIATINDGHPVAEDRVKGYRFVIGKEMFGWIGPNGKSEWKRRIVFPQRVPGAMDLISTGDSMWEGVETTPLIRELLVETTPAIYELKKDILRICQAKPGAYLRPTSFDAYEGSGRTSITLKRVRPDSAAALWILATLLVGATLLFWLKHGLYHRWKRKATAAPKSPPSGDGPSVAKSPSTMPV